jgi:hypothetical protein
MIESLNSWWWWEDYPLGMARSNLHERLFAKIVSGKMVV